MVQAGTRRKDVASMAEPVSTNGLTGLCFFPSHNSETKPPVQRPRLTRNATQIASLMGDIRSMRRIPNR
jgi:hypothetical protein